MVEGLIVSPQVDWYPGAINITEDDDRILGEPVTQGLVTSRTLTFKSLRTSLAGVYECRGIVNIPTIDISGATNSSTFKVVVKGMQVQFYQFPPCMYRIIFFLAIAPVPMVTVSGNRNGTLYAGTTFALICDVTLDSSVVDSTVTVTAAWLGPGGEIFDNDSRYDIINSTLVTSGPSDYKLHRGRLMFSPLSTVDTGAYTCRAVVKSAPFVNPSDSGTGNVTINIQGINRSNIFL